MSTILENPTLRLAALVLFSSTGLVGWKLAAPAGGPPRSETTGEVVGKRAERTTRHARSAAADQAGKRMASIRLAGSPEARMRATVDLAHSLSPAEFAAWMDGGWFTLRGGPELTLFTKIVMERWKQEDEEGLLVWMLKNGNSGTNALNELAQKNPEKVIDFFRGNPGGTREMMVLWEMGKNHPELALTRFQEIVASGRWREVQGYAGELLQNLAEKDPAKLAAAAEGFPSAMKLQVEIALSRERLNKSFQDELQALWERPDGWNIFERNFHSVEGVGDKILAQLANIPPSWRGELASNAHGLVTPENAEKWWSMDLAAAGFSKRDIVHFRSQALLAIGRKDPEEAIRRMGEVGMESHQRESFVYSIFANMRDKEKARGFVSLLAEDADRSKALEILDQERVSSSGEDKMENPSDWLAKAAETSPGQGGMSYSMFSTLSDWDAGKIDELSRGFRAMETGKKTVVARMIVSSIGSYGRISDPLAGDALRHLIESPEPEVEGNNRNYNLMEKSGSYVVQLSTRDPGAASAWVATLPAGEAKTWTQRNLLNNWRQYDPKAAEQWEKALPAGERAALEELARKRK